MLDYFDTGSEGSWKLSRYWYLHTFRMFAFLCKDPTIRLPTSWEVTIDTQIMVQRPDTAQALANLLRLTIEEAEGQITVRDMQGKAYSPIPINDQQALYDNLAIALRFNARFANLVKYEGDSPTYKGAVVVVCKKDLVVYYADDLSDAYSNQCISAADALRESLVPIKRDDVKLFTTTINERDFG